MNPLTVYVSIGNSDDRLTQARWSSLTVELHNVAAEYASETHGFWYSAPGVMWQNACMCIEIPPANVEAAQRELRRLAAEYGQDSIVWAEATTTFLEPSK